MGRRLVRVGGKNRYDQSSLGTRMKFSIKKFQTSKYVAFKKKSSKKYLLTLPLLLSDRNIGGTETSSGNKLNT